LAAFLHHENSYIKMQAVRAVGLLKYAPSGPDIVQLLETTRQERQANGQADLQTRLDWREDDLYSLQNQLIRAAGDLRLEEAVPLLVETAQKDIGLRGLAVEALISIGVDFDPELVTNLLSDPSVYLRKRLMALITQHNYRPALPLVRPLLRSENASTRSAALQAVTQLNDTKSVAEVVWMCFHDSNPFVRVQAVQSLVQLAGKEAVPQLAQLAGDANFQVRKAAAAWLVEWEPAELPVMAVLAHFSSNSPEDELTPAIAAILEKNNFDPAEAPAGTPLRRSSIPPELEVEIPNLLVLLDRWRMALRQAETAVSNPEAQKIEDALSFLISVLNEASHGA
jgi:HEAT repeat protein